MDARIQPQTKAAGPPSNPIDNTEDILGNKPMMEKAIPKLAKYCNDDSILACTQFELTIQHHQHCVVGQ